jgi:hypothetical protein
MLNIGVGYTKPPLKFHDKYYLQLILQDINPLNTELTLSCRNYFFLILAHSVYKMWKLQEPKKLELWNKLHFEEEKTESI